VEGRPPPPPGWYPDPDGRGQRWWDGARWSATVAGIQPAPPPSSSGVWWKVLLGIALAAAVGIAGCAVLIATGVDEVKTELRAHAITRQQFQSVEEGQSRAAVVEQLGVDPIGDDSLDDDVPPGQRSRSCIYYSREGTTLDFFEFCFNRGNLVSKRSF
jgi:hypothetical protein